MWIGFGWALVAMLLIAGTAVVVGTAVLVIGLARLVAAERWRAEARAELDRS